MSKEIDIIVANPAGNTTIMVLTPTPRSEYQDTANKLLDMDFGGEQVAYILPPADEFLNDNKLPSSNKDTPLSSNQDDASLPAMEMCGLEFCGNASRAFAYYRVAMCGDGNPLAGGESVKCNELDANRNAVACSESVKCNDSDTFNNHQSDSRKTLKIRVSGCDYPLTAIIDVDGNNAQIQMPVPINIDEIDGNSLIDLGGISHLILRNIDATPEKFDELKAHAYEQYPGMEAFGVMFIDMTADNALLTNHEQNCTGQNDTEHAAYTMAPVVYVADVDTTYFEGSCASGTTAASCALALADKTADGTFEYTFKQPAGTLFTTVTKKSGKITDIQLSGLMEMSDVITVEL